MIEGWPERIAEAQHFREYSIGGTRYLRVPYGSETVDWNAQHRPCPDCAVTHGQLHVPSCDVEQCPSCGEQALSCNCEHDESES